MKNIILKVPVGLAAKIGLTEAIVLSQLDYLTSISRMKRDGRKWAFGTLDDLHKKYFPFWGKATLWRALHKLERDGLIKVGNYNKLKLDRTKWYSLNCDIREMNCPSDQNDSWI